jgi:Glycosyltransferase
MASTSYPSDQRDWRGRFIADMAAALGRRDDVALSLWAPPGELPSGVASALLAGDGEWLNGLSRRGGIANLLRRGRLSGGFATLGLLRRLRRAYRRTSAEVVHANWLQNALPLWGTPTPALVTVLGSDYGLLDRPGMAVALRRVLAGRRAILAPNAEWMAPKLKRLFGSVAEVQPIPFGVDGAWFDVIREPGCQTRSWLVVLRVTGAKIGPLFEWGESLFGPGRELHLFGPMQEEVAIPSWVHYHGPTHPTELREEWFPRAAGLLTLSRHDEGRPQVVLEAMAAGLPVIASDRAAHRDVIRDGETGFLVDSSGALRDALERLDRVEDNRPWGRGEGVGYAPTSAPGMIVPPAMQPPIATCWRGDRERRSAAARGRRLSRHGPGAPADGGG